MSEQNTNLTINTDASFSPTTKKGGYGIWIVYQDQRYKYSGAFKGNLQDSTEAEMKALINAFHIISNWPIKVDRVIVNCDNKWVRDCIDGKLGQVKEKYKDLIKTLRSYTKNYPMVYSKKIKGHQNGKNSPRQYVNNWCDEKAREGRLEAEKGLETQLKIEFGYGEYNFSAAVS